MRAQAGDAGGVIGAGRSGWGDRGRAIESIFARRLKEPSVNRNYTSMPLEWYAVDPVSARR